MLLQSIGLHFDFLPYLACMLCFFLCRHTHLVGRHHLWKTNVEKQSDHCKKEINVWE